MTAPDALLENHTVMVRDGRIVEILPASAAAASYSATLRVERPAHLVLPGLINAFTRLAPADGRPRRQDELQGAARLRIAAMLAAGTTCVATVDLHPHVAADMAAEQGLRAIVGIPIAETASAWAGTPAEYLTRALEFRDRYRDHPSIGTAFAPLAPTQLADATLSKIATLADEVDAGILMALHESAPDVAACLARHGVRPIERLDALGLLTPALTAACMAEASASDLALARRAGASIVLCPQSSLRAGAPPCADSWTAAGWRVGLGGGLGAHPTGADLWPELKLVALQSPAAPARSAWDALAAATRGGAAALGLDGETGTLEAGKWADLIGLDLRGPALRCARAAHDRADAICAVVFDGGRDLVTDVWVAGRQLLNDGVFTRLEWPMTGGSR